MEFWSIASLCRLGSCVVFRQCLSLAKNAAILNDIRLIELVEKYLQMEYSLHNKSGQLFMAVLSLGMQKLILSVFVEADWR